MEKIKVTIKPSGDTILDVSGVQGPRCKDLTAALEKALGTPTSDVDKQEIYEQVSDANQNQSQ